MGIDESRFVKIPNPYFLEGLKSTKPETWAEKLFHSVAFNGDDMLTVKGPPPAKPGFPEPKSRQEVCKNVARAFTVLGIAGIIAGPFRDGGHEVVVFHPAYGVTSIEESDESRPPDSGV